MIIEKIPFLVVAGGSAVVTYYSQKATAGTYNLGETSPVRIPLILCHNIVFYPWKMLWPVNLSSYYPFPRQMSLADPMMLMGVRLTVLLILLLILSLRWTRALAVGWLFFFLAILPTMGVVGFTIVIASDKYAYFPVLGFLLVLAAVLNRLWNRGQQTKVWRAGLVLGVGLLAGLEARATQRYLTQWQDSATLAKHMLDSRRTDLPCTTCWAARGWRRRSTQRPRRRSASVSTSILSITIAWTTWAWCSWNRGRSSRPSRTSARRRGWARTIPTPATTWPRHIFGWRSWTKRKSGIAARSKSTRNTSWLTTIWAAS